MRTRKGRATVLSSVACVSLHDTQKKKRYTDRPDGHVKFDALPAGGGNGKDLAILFHAQTDADDGYGVCGHMACLPRVPSAPRTAQGRTVAYG